MRVSVVVYDEDALDGTSHAKVLIVVLQALETRGNGGVFLRLGFFRARINIQVLKGRNGYGGQQKRREGGGREVQY